MPRRELRERSSSKRQEEAQARVSRGQTENFEVLSLRDKARDTFVSALLRPPVPNAAARTAAKRYLRH
jgi:uncharacterized protein (DUF1778 family)